MTRAVVGKWVLLGFAGVMSLPVWAQTTGSSSGAGASSGSGRGTTGSTTGTLPGNTTTTMPGTGTTPTAPMNMPVYLTGKVTLEDGSPPPDPVTIERVCNGVAHNAGYSDHQGNFAIELGNEQGVFQDATDGISGRQALGGGSGRGSQERMLQNCELRGKLVGYRSQSILLAGRRPMDDPNVGTILLHKDGAAEGRTVSATSLGAPKNAQKAFDKGEELARKGQLGEALTSFQKAIEIYPNYAAAWTEVGKVQSAAKRSDEARFALEKAIAIDPKFVEPYVEMSHMAYLDKQWPQLLDWTGRGMKLDPFDYPQLFLLNALAHYNLHHNDAAEVSLKEAERLDTQHRFPETAHLRGLLFAQRHEYAMACDWLQTYLKTAPNAEDTEVVRAQLAQFEKARATSAEKAEKQ